MSRLARTHSKEIADKYQLLGWTLKHEFRLAPEDEPYEYVFAWEEGEEAHYPEIRGARVPDQLELKLSCLELVVLMSAMFIAIYGPVPPRLDNLTPEDQEAIARLDDQCLALRDIAWSQAGAEEISARDEVIAARLQTSADIQLWKDEAQLLARVLSVCADEVDAHSDITAVTGFQEYGADSAHFRELRQRLINAISK